MFFVSDFTIQEVHIDMNKKVNGNILYFIPP